MRPSENHGVAYDSVPLGGRLFLEIDEAAAYFGVSTRTARRWAADYIASGGRHGLPVVQVTARRRMVPVPKLLELAGAKPPGTAGGPGGDLRDPDASPERSRVLFSDESEGE